MHAWSLEPDLKAEKEEVEGGGCWLMELLLLGSLDR